MTEVASGPRFPVERGEVPRVHRQAPTVKVRVPVAFAALRLAGGKENKEKEHWNRMKRISGRDNWRKKKGRKESSNVSEG